MRRATETEQQQQTKKTKTMTTTKNQSDKQRLNEAFKQLRRHGFVAKQKHACCQSCGWAELPDATVAPNVIFYHAQDADAIKDGKLVGKMFLAHRFTNERKGRLACAVLHQHGFYAKWDGTEDTRIAIVNMTPELKLVAMLETADRICKKDGHEWGWQLTARELIKQSTKAI